MRLVNFFSWAFLLLFAAGVFALPSNQYRNVGEEEDETEANGQQQHLNDEEVLELVVKNPFFKHLRSSINGVLRERMDTFHFDDVTLFNLQMPYLGRFAFTVGNFHIRNLTFLDLDHTLVKVRNGKLELDVKQLHANVTGEYVIVRGQNNVGAYHGPLSAACTVDLSTDLRFFKMDSFDFGASVSNTMVNVNEFKAEIPGTFIGWLIDLVTRLFTNVVNGLISLYLRKKLQQEIVPLLAAALNEQVSLGRPRILHVGESNMTALLLSDPEISERDGIRIHLGIAE